MSIDIKEKIISPCIKVCKPNWKGYCVGCYRDILEITHWTTVSDDERKQTMAEIPKRKELYNLDIKKQRIIKSYRAPFFDSVNSSAGQDN